MPRHFQFSTITQHRLTERLTSNAREVLDRVQAGPDKDRWPGGEGAPDLIVLLLRSALLPFAAIRSCAETHSIPLPAVIGAHIGAELYRQFRDERGMEQWITFILATQEEKSDYQAWLDDNEYMQSVVAGMKHDAAAAGVSSPGRIMIYDDFESESGTMHAARHLIGHAFPDAQLETSVPMVETYDVVRELLPDIPVPAEDMEHVYGFLEELATGYYETPSGLVPLDSPQQLRRLGQQERHRQGKAYALLAGLYGDEQLLTFAARVQETFCALGQTIDLTPPPPRRRVWLLTGAPGTGKTTVMQKTLALLRKEREDDLEPTGFFIDVNGDGHRYDLVSLDGKRVPLATAAEHDFSDPAPVTVPGGVELTVDRAALDEMVRQKLAGTWGGRPVFIDEIGLLPIASDLFSATIWRLIGNGSGWLLGTITPHSHPFINRIKAHPAVELIEVTEENRDALPAQLARRLPRRADVCGWITEEELLVDVTLLASEEE